MKLGPVSVVVAAVTVLAAPALASTAYPTSIYPAPVHSRGGALTACPNPAGLHSFTASATIAAGRNARRYGAVSEATDLGNSDRASWPQVRHQWRTKKPAKGAENLAVLGSQPASRSGYAVIVRYSCGQSLVAKSLLVTIGDRNARCVACRSQFFVVNRRGRALIYFVY
jgi:hypothetical protein